MLSRHPQRSSEWMEDPAIMSISPVAASRANWVRAHSLRGISAYCALCVVSRLGIAILSPTNFAILRIAASRMRDSEQSPLTAAALPSVSTSFPRGGVTKTLMRVRASFYEMERVEGFDFNRTTFAPFLSDKAISHSPARTQLFLASKKFFSSSKLPIRTNFGRCRYLEFCRAYSESATRQFIASMT